MNFCIHKYFYENSPFWRKVREEEKAVRDDASADTCGDSKSKEMAGSSIVHFESIDKRSLASLTLLRARIVKLLENSKNNIHPLTDIAVHIVGDFCASEVESYNQCFAGVSP